MVLHELTNALQMWVYPFKYLLLYINTFIYIFTIFFRQFPGTFMNVSVKIREQDLFPTEVVVGVFFLVVIAGLTSVVPFSFTVIRLWALL